ncbi:hypothetical protein F0562_005475 [Nyssa sinensis]|uniref:Uncharacterized protein n=1 Tax=Nyssa sinensis TaxID=561372 RepID=A0A5J5AMU6_9ASTE|nr:hypothetical protein F0562_005475 [Nyssa sinensis]
MVALASQGLVVDGGGERKGIVGNVVGMVGSEAAGRGELGKLAMLVAEYLAMVALGSIGMAGNGGNVGLGNVGMAGNGGNVAFGRGGIVGSVGTEGGEVCKSWRAAKLIWMPESVKATTKARMEQCL